jgi:hypothetical protein
MRSLDEDVLNVGAHLGVSENLVALVNNEEFTLTKKSHTFSKIINLRWARS